MQEDLDKIKKHHYMRRIDTKAAPRNYEFRFNDRKGNVKNILVAIDMIPGTKKSVASHLDITERKQIEDELRKHHEHLGELVTERTNELITAYEQLQQEITERKRAEQEMARLERLNLIGKMAAGIAHEIRNPMTTVRGFLQLFINKNEFAQSREYLELMIKEQDIKNIYPWLKNKTEDVNEQILNSIIEAMLPLMQADAANSEKFINLELNEIPDLLLNEKETRQLIVNLVRNGLEAISPVGI